MPNALALVDYAERVEDLWLILNSSYGIKDLEAIEILLACQLECPLPIPWIILETGYYNPEPHHAWFQFGPATVLSLPPIRVKRPRHFDRILEDILHMPAAPLIMVEPNFEKPPSIHHRVKHWRWFLQKTLRLRVPYPLVLQPTEPVFQQLRGAAEKALDNRWRGDAPVELPKPPPSLMYFAELLQRLSPWLDDWDTLMANLRSLAARRAFLLNKPIDKEDWRAVARVMLDSVPEWTQSLIKRMYQPRAWFDLRGFTDDKTLKEEVRRLRQSGIVQTYKGRWVLSPFNHLNEDVTSLIEGAVEL